MNVYELIKLLEEENNNDEIFIEIKFQEYAGAKIKKFHYDVGSIKK